ncbi:MAG: thioesterase domain-containing protein [Ktedonobacteraceae bacterium]
MNTVSQCNPWLFATKSRPYARLRLFCFPYAGGGASIYQIWNTILASEIEVCPVQLPGRENRMKERAIADFAELIETLVDVLQPYLNQPFAFFGHSMGALISFGLSRELRRQGHPLPVHLFASAYRAPQFPNQDEPPLHSLPESVLVKKLLEMNGTRREILDDPELRSFILPILRADFSVCESYVHTAEAPLPCPITAFGGLQDSRVSRQSLMAWREQTSDQFALRMLPGDHFFLQNMRTPLLQIITQKLNQRPVGAADNSA